MELEWEFVITIGCTVLERSQEAIKGHWAPPYARPLANLLNSFYEKTL